LNFFVIPEHSQLARHLVEIDVSVGDETLRTDHPKLAEILAANGDIHLAQVDVYYYADRFDTGLEEVYYWYPAEDVIVTDTWVEYVPA
jgi:RecJ-like exonuclease